MFKDLKTKGYFITLGFKYGADFLVYKDDPNFVHSEFLLHVEQYEDEISVNGLIQRERISVSNKKKLLMATVDKDYDIKYFNFQWKTI